MNTLPSKAEMRDMTPCTHRNTILVAESDDTVRHMLGRFLTGMGLEVLSAASGCEALNLIRFRAANLDGAILDQFLSDMNGVELLRALHEQRPDMPILFSSEYLDPGAVTGVPTRIHVIQKPYEFQALKATLLRMLPVE